MIIAFDLDNTIVENGTEENDFMDAVPIPNMVELVNMLYDDGNEIVIWTARSKPWSQLTVEEWLINDMGLKFHSLYMKKMNYTIYVDDRSIDWSEGLTKESLKIFMDRIEKEKQIAKEKGYE